MDSLTQAALGAAIGQATLGRQLGKTGAIAGALIATIPDLDIFLYAFYDSVDMLRIHRGHSHSIIFCLIGALALTLLIKQAKWFKTVAYLRLYWFTFLCLITHILLDYCTAYGTQLLLPFSDVRLGLDTINVVDPVYTLPLLIGTLAGLLIPKLKPYALRLNALGLVLSTVYLLFTLTNKQTVNARFTQDLEKENVEYINMLTMPVGTASINWYGVAATDSSVYLKKYNSFKDLAQPTVVFKKNERMLLDYDPEWVETMKWFSKGFYTVQKRQDTLLFFNLQVDMRGMVSTPDFDAPTQGYFWSTKNSDGKFTHGSGSLTL
jgi:inner membrane protein